MDLRGTSSVNVLKFVAMAAFSCKVAMMVIN